MSARESVDSFLGAVYHEDNYNCLHFARDVWLDLTGVDIGPKLLLAISSPRRGARVGLKARRQFERLPGPVDPCLVLMKQPKADSHMGIYLRGRVLHLTERGAEFGELPIVTRSFKDVRYYR